jgi:hypothetical protein
MSSERPWEVYNAKPNFSCTDMLVVWLAMDHSGHTKHSLVQCGWHRILPSREMANTENLESKDVTEEPVPFWIFFLTNWLWWAGKQDSYQTVTNFIKDEGLAGRITTGQ